MASAGKTGAIRAKQKAIKKLQGLFPGGERADIIARKQAELRELQGLQAKFEARTIDPKEEAERIAKREEERKAFTSKKPKEPSPIIQLQSPEERARIEEVNKTIQLNQQAPTQQEALAISLDFFKRQREGTLTPEDEPMIAALEATSTENALTAWSLGVGAPAFEALSSVIRIGASTLGRNIIGRLPSKIPKKIPRIDVDKIGAELQLTSQQTAALAKEIGRRRISQIATEATGYAVNGKTTKLTTSMLAKAGMGLGALGLTATLVGTYPFAQFELAEAADKIGIAMFKASNEGDFDTVDELTRVMDELLNPSVWDNIVSKIPFANVVRSVRKNLEAAQIASDVYKKLAQKGREEAEALAEEGFVSEFQKQQAEARETTLEQRETDTEFFRGQAEERRELELEQREADTAFFKEAAEDRRKIELEQRADDTAFFDQVAKDNRKRKLDERAADTAFFDALKRERTGEALTNAERQTISDWNAGKSALNFKWLGR